LEEVVVQLELKVGLLEVEVVELVLLEAVLHRPHQL
jgi:hypothetical protein